VPSSDEIQKNGAEVLKISMGILRNVEEHELYLYQQKNKSDKLIEEIEILKEKTSELEKENKELKEEINEVKKTIEELKDKKF